MICGLRSTAPGFCIYRGNGDPAPDAIVDAKDLSRLIAANL
jgi:hypothetical protein